MEETGAAEVFKTISLCIKKPIGKLNRRVKYGVRALAGVPHRVEGYVLQQRAAPYMLCVELFDSLTLST